MDGSWMTWTADLEDRRFAYLTDTSSVPAQTYFGLATRGTSGGPLADVPLSFSTNNGHLTSDSKIGFFMYLNRYLTMSILRTPRQEDSARPARRL